ncbi:MAG: SPOR domain-containing protein [Acidobacteriota bacterium]
MQFKQSFLSAIIILSLCASFVYANSTDTGIGYTLQVAAFPETAEAEAENFVTKLAEAGEQPIWGKVELPGRGNWVRVFIGTFKTQSEARQYGEQLVGRRLIKEFLIKKSSEIKSLSRPRTVIRKDASNRAPRQINLAETTPDLDLGEATTGKRNLPQVIARKPSELPQQPLRPPPNEVAARPPTAGHSPKSVSDPETAPTPNQPSNQRQDKPTTLSKSLSGRKAQIQSVSSKMPSGDYSSASRTNISLANQLLSGRFALDLPNRAGKKTLLHLSPTLDPTIVPRADAVRVALNLLMTQAAPSTTSRQGGLWLGGDTQDGLARLGWILGEDADLISLDDNHQVLLNTAKLAKSAGVEAAKDADAPLRVLNYILENEGLLLMVQLTQSAHRYQLFIGKQVMTFGGWVKLSGSINLDNNFDRRINPHRRNHKKLDIERPPDGFDSLVAINAVARWFNLHTNKFVPDGNITFHELAEAYAKVELGFEYLSDVEMPGAHQMALEREVQLKKQRPNGALVLTLGSNRVLKSDEDWKQFAAEQNGERQQED